ncbi:hypothetical protein IS519_01710 [Vibrio crassostreae]|uniref:hypothetical protein n=1 Tax=Vibrio crassostreae TaxID=246167 RepID=UPI00200A8FD9|nr:hypothetical protein [Vibrio crassostreae]UPR30023.1 hypothetical protein IS519_01710 [Vibrio crassostreae]
MLATQVLSSATITDKKVTIELLQDKIRLLEVQNEILASSTSDIQFMYLAALAFAATFLIAFLGVNVYFTKSKYEEERRSLESLFKSNVKELSNLNKTEIQQKLEEIQTDLNESLVSSNERTNSRIDLLKRSLGHEKLNREFDLCKVEIKCTDIKATKARLYIRAALLANELGRDSTVADQLISLNELMNEGAKIGSLSVSDAIKNLRSLPNHHEQLVEKLERKIIAAHEPA